MFAEEIRFCELVSEQVFNWCSALGYLWESEDKVTGGAFVSARIHGSKESQTGVGGWVGQCLCIILTGCLKHLAALPVAVDCNASICCLLSAFRADYAMHLASQTRPSSSVFLD